MWPDETTSDHLATANGTPFKRARLYPNGGGDRATIHAPEAVADGGRVRLVIAFHGTDGFDSTMDGVSQVPTRDALLDAGYVIATAQLGTNTWGNDEAQALLAQLYAWAGQVWEIHGTVFYGQSQGGAGAFTAARLGTIPGLRAIAGLAPALNLQWISDHGDSGADVRAAYGATTTAELLDAAAAHAPLLATPGDYAGLRVKMWASNADTTTPKAEHADRFTALDLDAGTSETRVVTVSGGHLSADHYRPAEVVKLYADAFTSRTGTGAARIWDGTRWTHAAARIWDGTRWQPTDLTCY